MTILFHEFIQQFVGNPILRITVLLILGVILVNGWTDAPNAIVTCVATGAMNMQKAIRMAAVFNFAGMLFMTMLNSRVAFTIYHMVDFGMNSVMALTALCAAMTAIIVWAAAAWCFGIPTSESHALIAGLSGAAIAIHNGAAGINGSEWIKVLYGLILSAVLGFCMGYICGKAVNGYTAAALKKPSFDKAQIAGAAAMAFMHGAQDGQKFMAVFMLGICLAGDRPEMMDFQIPFWMMVLCSGIMAAGTSIGGKRIIQMVGNDMVSLKKPQGFASDVSGALCLLFSTLIGIPVSTTHVKTTSIMGVGASEDISNVNKNVVEKMIAAWILTFPGCGVIGYLTAMLYMAII
ncbi:MAG: inorganic phosphate transporter [Clostridiales bacterium]|nr:inorganic phosphate transporter [Clostridiales bacterium]